MSTKSQATKKAAAKQSPAEMMQRYYSQTPQATREQKDRMSNYICYKNCHGEK